MSDVACGRVLLLGLTAPAQPLWLPLAPTHPRTHLPEPISAPRASNSSPTTH